MGKKMLRYGLSEGLGLVGDKLRGEKGTAKQRLKNVALKSLMAADDVARGYKSPKSVGRLARGRARGRAKPRKPRGKPRKARGKPRKGKARGLFD